MASRKIGTPATANQEAAQLPLPDQVQAALTWLKSKSTKRDRENMVRFAISASKFFGVSMANMKILAKRLGRNHELAAALWDTGWYEARMLASMIDEPAQVTPAQMDRWCRDFDNWGICDTVCFCLFDRTPYAWRKVAQWGYPEGRIRQAARLLRCCGVSAYMTRAPATSGLPRACSSLSVPQPTNGTSSRRP